MAFPRHKGDQQVLAEGEFTLIGGRSVCEYLTHLDALALGHDRALVDRCSLVGARELVQRVRRVIAVVFRDGDQLRGDLGHRTGLRCQNHVASVVGGPELHAGADKWSLGPQERHRLALHVRAHQCAVGVIVLEERNHRGSHGPQLARRHVHVVDLVGLHELNFATLATNQNAIFGHRTVVLQWRICLCDDKSVFLISGEVVDLIAHLAVHDLAVRSFNETEGIDATVGGQRAD